MRRPQKNSSETFFDQFEDMSVDEQTIALMILSELHRQKRRGRAAITTTSAEMQEVVNANLRQIRRVSETTPPDEIAEALEESIARANFGKVR